MDINDEVSAAAFPQSSCAKVYKGSYRLGKQNSSKASRIIGPFVFLQGLLKGKDYKVLLNPQSKFLTKGEQTFAVRAPTL